MKRPLVEQFGEYDTQRVRIWDGRVAREGVSPVYHIDVADCACISLLPWEVDSLIEAFMRLRQRARDRGIEKA